MPPNTAFIVSASTGFSTRRMLVFAPTAAVAKSLALSKLRASYNSPPAITVRPIVEIAERELAINLGLDDESIPDDFAPA